MRSGKSFFGDLWLWRAEEIGSFESGMCDMDRG